MEDILEAHLHGTRFGIGTDSSTGLLRGGADGWALTWMDARVDGTPITPRSGMPVEVEALWINALGAAATLMERVGRDAERWWAYRNMAASSFVRLFTRNGRSWVWWTSSGPTARHPRRSDPTSSWRRRFPMGRCRTPPGRGLWSRHASIRS